MLKVHLSSQQQEKNKGYVIMCLLLSARKKLASMIPALREGWVGSPGLCSPSSSVMECQELSFQRFSVPNSKVSTIMPVLVRLLQSTKGDDMYKWALCPKISYMKESYSSVFLIAKDAPGMGFLFQFKVGKKFL